MGNLTGMFDEVNQKVGVVSTQVGLTPQAWNHDIFSMVQNLSETVMVPIDWVILAYVMTLELIQLIVDKNNFHDIESAVFFKWIFKSACAILIVTNTCLLYTSFPGHQALVCTHPDGHNHSGNILSLIHILYVVSFLYSIRKISMTKKPMLKMGKSFFSMLI